MGLQAVCFLAAEQHPARPLLCHACMQSGLVQLLAFCNSCCWSATLLGTSPPSPSCSCCGCCCDVPVGVAVPCAGCYSLSRLLDEGVVAGCEGDVCSALGMLWGKTMTRQVPWMANVAQVGAGAAAGQEAARSSCCALGGGPAGPAAMACTPAPSRIEMGWQPATRAARMRPH